VRVGGGMWGVGFVVAWWWAGGSALRRGRVGGLGRLYPRSLFGVDIHEKPIEGGERQHKGSLWSLLLNGDGQRTSQSERPGRGAHHSLYSLFHSGLQPSGNLGGGGPEGAETGSAMLPVSFSKAYRRILCDRDDLDVFNRGGRRVAYDAVRAGIRSRGQGVIKYSGRLCGAIRWQQSRRPTKEREVAVLRGPGSEITSPGSRNQCFYFQRAATRWTGRAGCSAPTPNLPAINLPAILPRTNEDQALRNLPPAERIPSIREYENERLPTSEQYAPDDYRGVCGASSGTCHWTHRK
jgi:hypothetical protein